MAFSEVLGLYCLGKSGIGEKEKSRKVERWKIRGTHEVIYCVVQVISLILTIVSILSFFANYFFEKALRMTTKIVRKNMRISRMGE